MSTWAGLADQSSGSWLAKLGDTEPLDLAISCCFLLTLAAISAAALRRDLLVTDRLRWLAVGAVVAGLLVNQQGDFHTRVIAEARANVDLVDAVLGRSVTLDEARGGVALVAVVAGLIILALSIAGRPPGLFGGAGLLLFLLYATARGALWAGLIGGGPAPEALVVALKELEVVALALVFVGAIRWRGSPPDPDATPRQGVPDERPGTPAPAA